MVVWSCTANVCTRTFPWCCGSPIWMHANRYHFLSPMICTHQHNIRVYIDNSTENSLATAAKNIPAQTHSLPARNTKTTATVGHICAEKIKACSLYQWRSNTETEKNIIGGKTITIYPSTPCANYHKYPFMLTLSSVLQRSLVTFQNDKMHLPFSVTLQF